MTQTSDYSPFGVAFNEKVFGVNQQNYQFTGKESQKDFGLRRISFFARDYNPSIGRWCGKDELAGSYSQFSPYTYVGNMPTMYIDPDGRRLYLANRNKEQEIEDILSLINNAKFEGEVTLNFIETEKGTEVKSDFGDLSHEVISGDAGLSLLNDLTNSRENYLYEVSKSFSGINRETGEPTKEYKFAINGLGRNSVCVKFVSDG